MVNQLRLGGQLVAGTQQPLGHALTQDAGELGVSRFKGFTVDGCGLLQDVVFWLFRHLILNRKR
jgi:hypothetical protein